MVVERERLFSLPVKRRFFISRALVCEYVTARSMAELRVSVRRREILPESV